METLFEAVSVEEIPILFSLPIRDGNLVKDGLKEKKETL